MDGGSACLRRHLIHVIQGWHAYAVWHQLAFPHLEYVVFIYTTIYILSLTMHGRRIRQSLIIKGQKSCPNWPNSRALPTWYFLNENTDCLDKLTKTSDPKCHFALHLALYGLLHYAATRTRSSIMSQLDTSHSINLTNTYAYSRSAVF